MRANDRSNHIEYAKTTRPGCAGVLARTRLFARLDEARLKPVVWISGPPGAGKTMLAASYLQAHAVNCLWYQIDETDGDVASFFYHLEVAAAARSRRRPPKLPRLSPQHLTGLAAFARRWFQAYYVQFREAFTIVFDGYHDVPLQSALHEVMSIALSELPPRGTVMLLSRTDPPPSMARLRANRALDVIGWDDLRLTGEESAAIATQRGAPKDDGRLRDLYEKTQGWAAGLILMLEQSTESMSSAPADLSTPQLVFDYLAGEFFDKIDAVTREVLLTTAALPQMTVAMAQALSGQEDAGERLHHLYRGNYFVTLKQASPEPVFGYHPLMREFIVARANATLPRARRQALQTTAAALLQEQGLLAEAVDLARANADYERIADIVRRNGRILLDSGRSETLAQWVESLPKSFQEERPWLLYWLGVARTHTSPREGRRAHERAYELFAAQPQPERRGLLLTCSGAMDAILYELDDFSLLDRWIDVMDRMLREQADLVSGPLEARIICSLFTSMVLRQPHHPEIEYWAERAYSTSRAQDDVNLRMSVEPRIALGITYAGHFPKAWAIIEAVRELARTHEMTPHALAMLRLVEATYYMLTARGEECYGAVRAGLELERTEGLNLFTRQLLEYGAGGALTAGDLDAAQRYLGELAEVPGVPARFDRCLQHFFSTWLALRRNDHVRAYQQQKLALRMAIEVGCPVFEALCRIASAQVHHAVGEMPSAWLQFQQVYDSVRHIRNHLLEFTGLLAYAHIALESGRRPSSGMRALHRALVLGKPRNYVSFPLWQPGMLAQLCSVALEADIEPDFVRRLIRERCLTLDAAASALLDWPWPLRIHTLGRFGVSRAGEAITFSGKMQRRPLELLKVLVAHGGREVSESRVIEALWPRVDGDSAHLSFTSTLHRLRKLLGVEGAIQLAGGKLSFDGRVVWLDTWAVDQLGLRVSRALREASASGADAAELGTLAQYTVEFYSGPFLDSDSDATWAYAMRDRMRQRFVRTVIDVARHWEAKREAERSIELLERAIDTDNVSEPVYGCLMSCYAALGRRAEALETYGRCRAILASTLGVAPSPETTALYQRLLQSP